MSEINSFKFKRKAGGNTTLRFSTGHSKTVFGGDCVTISAREVVLLSKIDPRKNKLSVFELVGPGDVNEVGPKTEAEKALAAITAEAPLDKAAGSEMQIVDAGRGWFDVYDAEGKKLTTSKLREDKARELAGLPPKPEVDKLQGNTEENTESSTVDG
jgi:hypothetical protein